MPVGERLPRVRIDRDASGMELQYDVAQAHRYQKVEILSSIEALVNKDKPADSPSLPARLYIRGAIVDERGWLWAIASGYWYLLWNLLGGPTYEATATVDIELEVRGYRKIVMTGSGKCYAGMWYPGDPSACAFAKAITNALMQGLFGKCTNGWDRSDNQATRWNVTMDAAS